MEGKTEEVDEERKARAQNAIAHPHGRFSVAR